jgi:hypothetical protein
MTALFRTHITPIRTAAPAGNRPAAYLFVCRRVCRRSATRFSVRPCTSLLRGSVLPVPPQLYSTSKCCAAMRTGRFSPVTTRDLQLSQCRLASGLAPSQSRLRGPRAAAVPVPALLDWCSFVVSSSAATARAPLAGQDSLLVSGRWCRYVCCRVRCALHCIDAVVQRTARPYVRCTVTDHVTARPKPAKSTQSTQSTQSMHEQQPNTALTGRFGPGSVVRGWPSTFAPSYSGLQLVPPSGLSV